MKIKLSAGGDLFRQENWKILDNNSTLNFSSAAKSLPDVKQLQIHYKKCARYEEVFIHEKFREKIPCSCVNEMLLCVRFCFDSYEKKKKIYENVVWNEKRSCHRRHTGKNLHSIPDYIRSVYLNTTAATQPHSRFFSLLLLIASFVICDSFFLASRAGKILKNFGIFVFCYYDLVTTTKISKTK